jgi:uncharacterized protein
MPQDNSKVIEVVLKVTERCNINCTYCYVFNKGDESYKQHDRVIKTETVEKLAEYLRSGVSQLDTTEIYIDFHGGEPLMMGKRRFDGVCALLVEQLASICHLRFSIQTNGMLIDDDWIDIFQRYNVNVGVSLDGPAEINDIERLDHQGRGTYERAVRGLRALKVARDEGRIASMGILVVANPSFNGGRIYRHLVHELGIANIDFLLPIESHDSFDPSQARQYGRFLNEAFDEWVSDDDPLIYVRIFASAITFLRDGQDSAVMMRRARDGQHQIITVASNGDVGPDDSLRTLRLGLFSENNIRTTPLRDYLSSPTFRGLMEAESMVPDGCRDCCWKNLCRGGAMNGRLINRFSGEGGFNNPSIICEGLQSFYAHVAAYLLRRGLGYERLKTSLLHEGSGMTEYEGACAFARPQEPKGHATASVASTAGAHI